MVGSGGRDFDLEATELFMPGRRRRGSLTCAAKHFPQNPAQRSFQRLVGLSRNSDVSLGIIKRSKCASSAVPPHDVELTAWVQHCRRVTANVEPACMRG
jgi:hypothetical protein